jgi:hypothetical protein
MVLGEKSVQVSELFVVHGYRASAAIPRIYRNLLIPSQLSTRPVTFPGTKPDGYGCRGRPASAARCSSVNPLLTMPA